MTLKKLAKKGYRAILRKMPDKLAMHIDYLRGYKRILNLKNPKTFGEKIQWIKIYGGLEDYSQLVDKYSVRNIIKSKIGEKYLAKLYGVYYNADDIDFEKLPNRFVLKCTHGCGYNLICKDKTMLSIEETRAILHKWMNEEFYKNAKEIQYKNVTPTIICEEYLEDNQGKLLDYKYFCFNGKPEFIEVVSDRGNDTRADFYTTNWEKINLRTKFKNSNSNIESPKGLELMTELAEELSRDYPFVRVDFYNVDGRIIFGELTFTPGGGVSKFRPIEKDIEIASKIDLFMYK